MPGRRTIIHDHPAASRRGVAAAAMALAVGVTALVVPSIAGAATCATPPPMGFEPPSYVDENRAGGEPMVVSLPDGTLLYGAHAGTTHFYTPAGGDPTTTAFLANYEGQTYLWRSADDGASWEFVPRSVPANVPASGFSDPEFAIDTAGNVYYSEINLVNVAVSRSADGGKTFTLENFFGEVLTDRQWSEADEEGVLYITGNSFGGGTFPTKPAGNLGHFLYKSKDGGATFTGGVSLPGGLGDIKVDKRDGSVYEASLENDVLWMTILRNARADDLTPLRRMIAGGVRMLSHWPSMDVDDDGNLYITWDESGRGSRPAGVYYSYSTDQGMSWAPPIRVDTDDRTDIWPWLAVGDPGRVAIAWLEAGRTLPGHDAQVDGEHGWRVVAAQSLTGLGCGGALRPGFTVSTVTPEPIHTGTVCQGGTGCQAEAIDRRLGDYFTIDIDGKGRLLAAYSDTRQGGAVALPGFSRQAAGLRFLTGTPGGEAGGLVVRGARQQQPPLPRTGFGGEAAALAGAALLAAAALIRRWNARGA